MHNSKTSLFLMEFIIAILFFSLTSAVCVQLFVKSHTLSRQSVNSNQACMWSENLAEIFYASAQFDQITASLCKAEGLSANSLTEKNLSDVKMQQCTKDLSDISAVAVYFDSNWSLISDPTNFSKASYKLVMFYGTDSKFAYSDIAVYEHNSSVLYDLHLKKYQQKGGVSHES